TNGEHKVYVVYKISYSKFKIIDEATFTISNIDNISPKIGSVEFTGETGWEKGLAKAKLIMKDCLDRESGLPANPYLFLKEEEAKKYMDSEGNWNRGALTGWQSSNEFEVNENGTYYCLLRDNVQGIDSRYYNVKGFDGEPPEIKSATAELKEVSGAYGKYALVTVVAEDKISGLADEPYSFGDEVMWQKSPEYKAEVNGSLVIQVKDRAGNVAQTNVEIKGVDAAAPDMKLSEEQEASNSANLRIKIHAEDADSGIALISYLNEGTGIPIDLKNLRQQDGSGPKSADTEVLIKNNGKYIFYVTDIVGNTREERLNVVKIVKEVQVDKGGSDSGSDSGDSEDGDSEGGSGGSGSGKKDGSGSGSSGSGKKGGSGGGSGSGSGGSGSGSGSSGGGSSVVTPVNPGSGSGGNKDVGSGESIGVKKPGDDNPSDSGGNGNGKGNGGSGDSAGGKGGTGNGSGNGSGSGGTGGSGDNSAGKAGSGGSSGKNGNSYGSGKTGATSSAKGKKGLSGNGSAYLIVDDDTSRKKKGVSGNGLSENGLGFGDGSDKGEENGDGLYAWEDEEYTIDDYLAGQDIRATEEELDAEALKEDKEKGSQTGIIIVIVLLLLLLVLIVLFVLYRMGKIELPFLNRNKDEDSEDDEDDYDMGGYDM
ncbi:MAG: hypothetical protein K5989_06865, partial [Lachnospiraceae bacterium]|nr:hypothetical protein [Lachnospiraceae bacterium]